ncbi:hypothetical protein [Micromonospora sp. U21]|uniref:hypothetical protein n=1 Tax=Micromonospora sp. U21 TaxID=2824899 RepID=UPI001B375C00|nr:hypothetical protein [Micromonospora sp. U21]MBQ0901058.1 hypothetical protein [Micromonospora sp. U21]
MGTLLTQLPALLGVLVGTLGTILATSLTDRARWRRGQSVRWDERRLDAYVDYAHAIKESHAIALRMTADHRPGSHSHPIDRESGLVRLAEADARRTIVWENLLLLGGSRAAIKLGEYVEQAWQLTVPALRASLSAAAGPVLLHDAAVLARYRAMDRLYELVDVARGGVGACGCSARWRTRRCCPSWTVRSCGSATTSGSPCRTPGSSTHTAAQRPPPDGFGVHADWCDRPPYPDPMIVDGWATRHTDDPAAEPSTIKARVPGSWWVLVLGVSRFAVRPVGCGRLCR